MKFAALGRTHWLYDSIRTCIERGHQPALIGTCPAAPEYKVNEQDFEELSKEIGCPFFCDTKINSPQIIQMARESGAEIGISVNWLTIIRQQMLDTFKYGVLNAHAGDLPRYRGNAVPNWAIINGEAKVVITVHQMVEVLDGGPVFLKRTFPLDDRTYIGDVYQFIETTIPVMFADVMDRLENGSIIPTPQPEDPALSLRCFPRLPQDGLLDWGRSADQLARLVRASAEPFAGAYTYMNHEKLIVWRAYASELSYPYVGVPGQAATRDPVNGTVTVLSGSGVLVLEEVESPSAGRGKASDIIRSLRTRLGMTVENHIEQLYQKISELEAKIENIQKYQEN